jgi:hypothetical protein
MCQPLYTKVDRDGTGIFPDSIREDAVAEPEIRQAAITNTMENFGYAFPLLKTAQKV